MKYKDISLFNKLKRENQTMDNTINLNVTTIIFNDKLKDWINELIIYFGDDMEILSEFNGYELQEILDFQAYIRTVFIQKQYINMLSNGAKLTSHCVNYSNIFALFMLLICDNINDCNYWGDVMTNIKKKTAIDYLDLHDTPIEYNLNCLCGKSVTVELYLIVNTKTNMKLYAGCICIWKSGIATKQELEKIKRNKLKDNELKKKQKIQDAKNAEIMKIWKEKTRIQQLEIQELHNMSNEENQTKLYYNALKLLRIISLWKNISFKVKIKKFINLICKIKMKTYIDCNYDDNYIIKRNGAIFDGEKKMWFINGKIPIYLEDYTIVDLCVPYELKDEAKASGAKWDMIRKTWYSHKKRVETTDLKNYI